ncbi:MAG TPA: hypothetical protein VM221_08115 [Armatimonadota bacterium]|nr:hypothetical protein [Armatimonadota bacterium]
MRRLTTAGLMLVVVLAAGRSPAWVQQEPAPQVESAPPIAPAPPAESVLLRLKFKPNETMRYRIYAEAEGQMRTDLLMPAAGAGMPGEIPIHMVVQGEGVAKVLGVDAAGGARLRMRADNLSLKMELMGQRMEMSVKGGKCEFKHNDQQVEGGKLPPMLGKMRIPLLQDPIEIKLGPRGEVLDLAIPGISDLAAMVPGMSMRDMMKDQMLLPEEPLTVGQLLEESRSEPLPGTQALATTSVKMMLKSIETWSGGRKIANLRVESVTSAHDVDLGAAARATGAAGGAPPVSGTMSMDQQLAGNMQFDATRGMMMRFDFQLSQQMSMSSSFDVPNQGPQTMNRDLQLSINGAVAKV